MPRLAQLVAASPLEAAIHDAYGKALGQNSYNLLGRSSSAATWPPTLAATSPASTSTGTCSAHPQPRMPLYHLIGALGSVDGRRLCRRGSVTVCRKPCPSGSPTTA